jgi:hypothetical protein
MSDQQPFTVWQECKAICEAAMPAPPLEPQESAKRLRAALLEKLASESDQGAKLAARLANADGPIKGEPEDLPLLLRYLTTASGQDGRALAHRKALTGD